jgi:Protein of unknown function (DUF2934)
MQLLEEENVMAKNEIKSKAGVGVEVIVPECVDANNFTQRVEKQAYELYAKRGFESGHEWDDWFEAERQVESEISTVDRDCIRSEGFYEATHRSSPLPSYMDPQKTGEKMSHEEFRINN